MGGSGGYARAQLETLEAGRSTYMMCMDDDVVCEPESIVRAVTFGDLCRRPTIVGGHMFSLYSKARLHSFGEIINQYRFWWMSPPTVRNDWDLAGRNLRSSRWLHRRIDVDFNGWFMCLIPTEVLRTVGLSLPLFIKWDDSEYGVRAGRGRLPDGHPARGPRSGTCRGPTRTTPWTGSPTSTSATGPSRRCCTRPTSTAAGWCGRASTTRSSTCSRCSTPPPSCGTSRWRTCWPGRSGCTPDLLTKLPELQAQATQYADARTSADPDAFPPARREKPPKKGQDPTTPKGRVGQLLAAATSAVRQVRPVRSLAERFPEARLAAMDAKWWMIAQFDSVVVSMPDGTSAAWYQRDKDEFGDLMRRTVEIHQRLLPGVAGAGPPLPAGAARPRLARAVGQDVRGRDPGHDPGPHPTTPAAQEDPA